MHAGYRIRLIDAISQVGYWCAAAGQYAAAVTLWAARDVQAESAGLVDHPAEQREREQPSEQASQGLDSQQVRASQERGAAMTLAAAAEFAIMMTSEHAPEPAALPSPGKLSTRERELITLVAQGKTDAEIAEKLFISVSTVRTHLDRIRDKSGCRRRADLTRLALQEGIV
jgi:DNA-binding CsgD family transcriptional regulator